MTLFFFIRKVVSKKSKSLSIAILLLIFLFTGNTFLFSQNNVYKWFNPAKAGSPVVAGRGWQNELASPYDRLPARAKKTLTNSSVWNLSHNSAGEYIDFKTSASSIIIHYKVQSDLAMPHMPATGVSGLDLYARDVNGNWLAAKADYKFDSVCEYKYSNLSLSAKEEEFRLYLPLYNTVSWLEIGVPTASSFAALPVDDEKPVVIYGTSIAQGACASRPGLAWTNILGRKLDRNIINLGFSGNGLLEEPVIDLINELDAKLYVLDCMPNLLQNRFSKEEIQKRIFLSVNKLQQKHPGVPVLLAAHCCGLPGSLNDTAFLHLYKNASNILAESFDVMKKSGVRNIFLLTDEAIGFDGESTVDRTHPNDIGMMKYAEAYESLIRKIFKEETTTGTTHAVRQRRDNATYDFFQRHKAILQLVKLKQPRLVLIGNSITHYWGGQPEAPIKRGASSWQKYFEPFNTINLGFGWDRIENALWRVHHGELDGYTADKIVINIGTNNLGINSDEEIVAGIKNLITAIRQHQPGAKIFLSGIYPRRSMEKRIVTLNVSLAMLEKEVPVTFFDAGKVFLKSDGTINENLFTDGLHPNVQGYELLGAFISTFIK